MSEITEERLQEIEARAAEATPGPWGGVGSIMEWDWKANAYRPDSSKPTVLAWNGQDWWAMTEADKAFVAAAREDVPALIAEVRRLRGELEESRKSQGYSQPPHWEPHWDRGSMEEV